MSAVDAFLERINGIGVPMLEGQKLPRCDSCSESIYPNREIQLYCSDREMVLGKSDTLKVQRMYGECCSIGRVKYPHKGTNELILRAEMGKPEEGYDSPEDAEWIIKDPDVIFVSGVDDGYVWDPVEVWEAVMRMPYEQNFVATGGIKNGPEDIVEALLLVNVDIRSVVDTEGNVNIPDEKRDEIDKGISEAAKELFGIDL